jgi:hypothetical protein
MPATTVPEIKKALIMAGLEVYRTRGDEVQIADRVRDNLIMDSGVSVHAGAATRIRMVVRAQRSDFPTESATTLFDRARALSASALARGYVEVASIASALKDPADSARTLDVWYEVTFERTLDDGADVIEETRFALSLEKIARAVPGR